MDGIRVGLSDKTDGNMKVIDPDDMVQTELSRQRFLGAMGLNNKSTYFVRVSFDTDDFCQFMEADEENGLWLGGKVKRCDGLLTTRKGVGLFLPLADCLGMVLYDKRNAAIMVVHCGRHTVLQDGAYKAVQYMMEAAGTKPEDVLAWLSPSAGKGNYPIYDLGGISLQEAVIEQLMRAGVDEMNTQMSDVDTTTHEHYFSHSQGDKRDRFAIVAVIDESSVK